MEDIKIEWYIPDKSIIVSFFKTLNLENAEYIDEYILREAQKYEHPLTLIIDARQMQTVLNFEQIRSVLKHPTKYGLLKNIYVITEKS